MQNLDRLKVDLLHTYIDECISILVAPEDVVDGFATAAWYIADLEARGPQELFTKQAPQKLKVLREHAIIESAVSSNRIEGVNIDPDRVKPVLIGKSALRDRDEEEIRFSGMPISPEFAGQSRVYFMPATIDPAVGEEVLIFIFDPSLNKKEMAKLGGLHVDLATGRVSTRAGPVGFALFIIPNPSGAAEPFRAYEMFFDPQDTNHLLPYRLLAEQSHWHYFVVGRGLKILGVVEFENVFSLGRVLPEIVERAGTMKRSELHRALPIVQAEFTLAELWNLAVSSRQAEVTSA